jgi:hypothetical protein
MSESSPADETAAECEQCLVEVGASFVADREALVVVQPGEGALDDPAHAPEAGAVGGRALGDAMADASLAEQ